MRKHVLLAGVAAAAVSFAPATTIAQDGTLADIVDELGDSLEERPDEGVSLGLEGTAEVHYENEIETEIETDVDFTKDVTLVGTVNLNGDINVDAAAVAIVDNKQALIGNTLYFSEENELNGENGFVDPVFGPGFSENGDLGAPFDFLDGDLQPQIRVGFFAPVVNTVDGLTLDVEGNVGINLSAGYYNIQENIAALAVSNFEGTDDDAGGMAEASLTTLQLSTLNFIGEDPVNDQAEDDEEAGGSANDWRIRNTVFATDSSVTVNGNAGINAAAGAMNTQKNALVLAVATDSAMAEATAGVIQASVGNLIDVQDEINIVSPGSFEGAGNLGVNIAAGSMNHQMNSLIAAVGLAGAGNGGGTPPDDPS
ncbi:hypothetical protein [Erythrobacter rubeus]|uniref:Uncharacterized protein n=1 Tax=Erythrobacter rubeus TaxID=2760803 RepID=A0ABR8KV70_9SPHN|nr:hypothetical protein [Erythrobacter rubeus]MBD2842126.1 hypothetical protein [Erythrobacter rubeus]